MVSEANSRVYIGYTTTANDGKNYVTILDTKTDSHIVDVEVCGPWADGIAVNSATGAVVVTSGRDLSNHCVSRIASDFSVSHITGIEQPWVVRRFSNSVDERFYVTAYAGSTVYELKGSPLSTSASIQVGINPRDLQVNPDTNRIYVSNEGSNTVSVIDANTNQLISTVEVGLSPRNLRIDRAANNVLVANYASGTVSVIDGETDQVMSTIDVGSGPRAIIIQ